MNRKNRGFLTAPVNRFPEGRGRPGAIGRTKGGLKLQGAHAQGRQRPPAEFPPLTGSDGVIRNGPIWSFTRGLISHIRRIDSRPVGISAPSQRNEGHRSFRLSARPAHDRVERLPIIAWNRCPRSAGMGAHHPVEHAATLSKNYVAAIEVMYAHPEIPPWRWRYSRNPAGNQQLIDCASSPRDDVCK